MWRERERKRENVSDVRDFEIWAGCASWIEFAFALAVIKAKNQTHCTRFLIPFCPFARSHSFVHYIFFTNSFFSVDDFSSDIESWRQSSLKAIHTTKRQYREFRFFSLFRLASVDGQFSNSILDRCIAPSGNFRIITHGGASKLNFSHLRQTKADADSSDFIQILIAFAEHIAFGEFESIE